MDNKFDEIEDVIIDDSEGVPVYEEPSVDTVEQVSEEIANEEVPVYESDVKPVEPISNYEEPSVDTVEQVSEETSNEEVPVYGSEIKQVEPLPSYEEASVDVVEQVSEEIANEEVPVYESDVKPVEPLPSYEEPNEHPDGKIVLNKKIEDKKEVVDVGDFKITDNKSLMFVFVVGIIIFVAIMVLPRLFY